jgi:hypothetical protein
VLSSYIVTIIFNQLNIKKEEDNFRENHKKNHAEKHCSNQQCFKEKNYKTKFSISSILKKKSKNIILKNKEIK